MPKFSADFVKDFADELSKEGFDKQPGFFSEDPRAGLSDAQNDAVEGMKYRLDRYSIELEKGGVSAERLTEISKEVFIIACGSTKSTDECIKFAQQCGLDKDPNFLNNFSKDDPTLNPLTAAVAGGRKDNVAGLVEAGANPNEKSPETGNTAAHFAVELGVDKKMMGTLIDAGVEINAENKVGMTALDIANVGGKDSAKLADFIEGKGGQKGSFQEKFSKALAGEGEDQGDKNKELFESIRRVDLSAVRQEIAHGADVNASENGVTAVQAAVNTGRTDIVGVTAFQAEIDTRRNLTNGNEDLIREAQVMGDQKSQVHVGVEVATETVLFSSQISEEISKREELLKKYNVGGSRSSDRSSGGAAMSA